MTTSVWADVAFDRIMCSAVTFRIREKGMTSSRSPARTGAGDAEGRGCCGGAACGWGAALAAGGAGFASGQLRLRSAGLLCLLLGHGGLAGVFGGGLRLGLWFNGSRSRSGGWRLRRATTVTAGPAGRLGRDHRQPGADVDRLAF